MSAPRCSPRARTTRCGSSCRSWSTTWSAPSSTDGSARASCGASGRRAWWPGRRRSPSTTDPHTSGGSCSPPSGCEPYSARVVRPHERTHEGPKEDRLKLLYGARTQISPVYGLYPDGPGDVWAAAGVTGEPEAELTGRDGTRNRFWWIDDPARCAAVASAMGNRWILIADGHHRYETAVRYREERRAAGDGDGPHDVVMMGLTAIEDPGLVVLPTHRCFERVARRRGRGVRRRARRRSRRPALRARRDVPGDAGVRPRDGRRRGRTDRAARRRSRPRRRTSTSPCSRNASCAERSARTRRRSPHAGC